MAAPIHAATDSVLVLRGVNFQTDTRKDDMATRQVSRKPNRPYLDPAW